MRAYCDNPEETAIVLKDGWLHSGDIARMDENGYFEIIGRKKDIIKVAKTDYLTAYKVYPTEVEETLLQHEKVLEAAVIGISDPLQGARVKAYIVLQPGANVTPEEAGQFLPARPGGIQSPFTGRIRKCPAQKYAWQNITKGIKGKSSIEVNPVKLDRIRPLIALPRPNISGCLVLILVMVILISVVCAMAK